MAEPSVPDLESDESKDYKPPERKTLHEIATLDKDDESLRRYKEQLLGNAVQRINPPFPNDPRNFILSSISICITGRPDIEVLVKDDLNAMKNNPINIPEGSVYRVKLKYFVQREIVCGLRYIQATYKGPIRASKTEVMLGSYGPKVEAHEWLSQEEDAPKGLLARGAYTIRSRFTDDDKTDHLTWEWLINITKE